ncbi:MerR family transcriptional regulator [Amycolatopsis cynarae]|uniref:MerR family transcriptional regulator n=1 Tax=Amycolatopsis cynarae TaxID=2995223 RepID=A0ABY7B6K9_9PSEU|nr:MerR family transcriptional regulator [Amycolatopsis sp. HUAS 11-8]WAL67059.1 MerR family transcriptional regulator [Amycolatopsis sp. HUAS 11-8]
MDQSPSLTIGAFARLAGLTPSALRFYDDCGVLEPAHVDEASGYRYYRPDQRQRALLLRDLRTAGLPLPEVGTVLDGPIEAAREVLEAHRRRIRRDTETATAALDRVLHGLDGAVATVLGWELAAAIRQVLPSAATGAPADEMPVLGCVLVELAEDELRLVATDRYRFALRALRPETSGGSGSLLLPAASARELAALVARRAEVGIDLGRRELDGQEMTTMDGEFPDYRQMLAALAPPRHRVLVDRRALRDALGTGPVALRPGRNELAVGGRTLPVLCDPAPLTVGFDPAVLGPALDASVGSDVLLELTDALQPVVLRSADQGAFTTLVMPIEFSGEPR